MKTDILKRTYWVIIELKNVKLEQLFLSCLSFSYLWFSVSFSGCLSLSLSLSLSFPFLFLFLFFTFDLRPIYCRMGNSPRHIFGAIFLSYPCVVNSYSRATIDGFEIDDVDVMFNRACRNTVKGVEGWRIGGGKGRGGEREGWNGWATEDGYTTRLIFRCNH